MSIQHIPSLYIHIPFCISKCIYCDFNSIVTKSQVVDEYLQVIERELQSASEKYSFTTVFIGGGTPTVLNETQLSRLLSMIAEYVDVRSLKEYTIEINPGTLNDEKIFIMKDRYITRVSIGVQSFNNRYLKLIGRIHSAQEAGDVFNALRKNKFENISIDLIYGYPTQTLNEWEKDLRECVRLAPEHISAYCLSYEEGTPIVRMAESGTLNKLSEEEELKLYEYTNNFLCSNDYVHYEISNFAKRGRECLHNTVYWENREYIGIGAGAFSYLNGERSGNITNVKEYISSALLKKELICFSERLPQKKRASEILIMALRMTAGISRKDFFRRSGFDLNELFEKQIHCLTQAGLIDFDEEKIRLTKKGLSLADTVMMEFV